MTDFIQSLQQKVEAETLDVISARDGILESFVVSNRTALGMGLFDISINAPDEEVYNQVRGIMRELLAERGGSFDTPSVSELRSVRHTIDLKLRFSELPPEIADNHDVICEAFLNKATHAPGEEGIVRPQPLDEPLAGTSIERALREELNKPEPETSPDHVQPFSQPSGFTELKPGTLSSIAPEEEASAPEPEPAPFVRQPEPMENPFLVSLEEKMKFDVLSPADARDGIIESFAQLLLESVNQGVTPWGFDVSEKEVETLVRGMMRDVFSAIGGSFDEPHPDLLVQATQMLSEQLNLVSCPEPVRARHAENCEALLAKTRKLVEAVAGVPSEPAGAPPPVEPEAEVVPEPIAPEVPVEPEPVAAEPSLPSLDASSVDSILARVRSELHDMVSKEIRSIMETRREQPVRPRPPAGIAAYSQEDTVFLAWLDAFEQPGYHVYQKMGSEWERVTHMPLVRPSFRIKLEGKGEHVFAVSAVSLQGVESELSPEVKVTV